MDEFIPAWANAVAQFEGYNTPGTVANRNHNPGNLKYAGQPGAVGKDSRGFAIFQDDVTGWQALYNQLQRYVVSYPGFSILDITAFYLGQPTPTVNSQGDAFQYAGFVASALGVSTSTTLAQLAAGTGSGTQPPSLPVPPELAPAGSPPTEVQTAGFPDYGGGQSDLSVLWFAVAGIAGLWLLSRWFGG